MKIQLTYQIELPYSLEKTPTDLFVYPSFITGREISYHFEVLNLNVFRILIT